MQLGGLNRAANSLSQPDMGCMNKEGELIGDWSLAIGTYSVGACCVIVSPPYAPNMISYHDISRKGFFPCSLMPSPSSLSPSEARDIISQTKMFEISHPKERDRLRLSYCMR